MKRWTAHPSPLGQLLLQASELGLCGLYFSGHKYFPGVEGEHSPDDPLLLRACAQLDEYFAGQRKRFDLPLHLKGTPFQQSVWKALEQFEWGQRGSYAQLAAWLGRPQAARAVGSAIGRNPVCIILPCHRVLTAKGEVSGYAGGPERKRFLLALEAG